MERKKTYTKDVKEFLADLNSDLLIDREKIIESKENINFKDDKNLNPRDTLVVSSKKIGLKVMSQLYS